MSFVRQAPSYQIRPVVGIDFRQGAKQLFVALAENNLGYQYLNSYLSYFSHSKIAIPELAPELPHTRIVYPLAQVKKLEKKTFSTHEYIGIGLEDVPSLHRSEWAAFEDHLVFLHPVSFRNKQDFNVHRLLRAIDTNELLSRLPPGEQGKETEKFISSETIEKAFENHRHILLNTASLLDQCHIQFDFSKKRKHQNLKHYFAGGGFENSEFDYRFLKKLAKKALPKRYGKSVSFSTRRRLITELETIKKMDYVAFFLVNWSIVHYAKRKGYFHVGRGSGANSMVAYLLGITDVDPIELELYFERFMNLYRANPPDFDIDFASNVRNEVTRYIFDRFGDKHQVALLATYNTFQYSAAVRELGKVFGIPKEELDDLSAGKFEFEKLDELSQLVIRYAKRLHGMPNLLSVHSSGIIISQKPIYHFSATNMPPKGFPTVQFDMEIAEDVGLFKYDILGQRGLGKIKDAIQIIQKNNPGLPRVNIHNVKHFMQDPNINRKISRAECIGAFYVESPAMRMLLRKLEVDNYLGLVAASSIIRPGVSKSGMMREYILRHRDSQRVMREAHPKMLEIMPETYGVMVYQEDVIKVAHFFAGLSLAEADQLRRGMSGKYRSREEFAKVKQKFFDNCRAKGEPEETIQEVWNQTESFAGYAFAKGHSASYAVESYQSLFLKTYFPLEFMVAVLNNGGGFYRTETYVHEARKQGGIIHAPHINISRTETIILGKDIYLGFQHLKGMEDILGAEIVREREQNGPYLSLEDFMDRVSAGAEQMEILLRTGAFNFTGINKRVMLWRALYRLNKESRKPAGQQHLFKTPVKQHQLPELTSTSLEDTFDHIELLGYPLCDPFELLMKEPDSPLTAAVLKEYQGREICIFGYLVTAKNTGTSNGEVMQFGTFLDRDGQWLDTVHFPPVAKKYPFRGKGIYRLTGKVTEEFGFYTLEVSEMEMMPYIKDPRFSAGRKDDFEFAKRVANLPFARNGHKNIPGFDYSRKKRP